MSGISLLQLPDELEFRLKLAGQGISPAAQDLLVADEAANRQRAAGLKQKSLVVWDTVRTFALLKVAGRDLNPVGLPAPSLVAALSRLIVAAEIVCTVDERHPAVRELSASRRSADARDWNAAIARALLCDLQSAPIRIEPVEMGSLLVFYAESERLDGHIARAEIRGVGDELLPRPWVKALAVEALHRLSGTSRHHDLPVVELRGVEFAGTGSGWSALLDPMLDGSGGGFVPVAPGDGSAPLIILPRK